MASVNSVSKRKAAAPKTYEGATAKRIDPVQQLRRSVMSNMLWENEFYEDGQSIAARIKDEVANVLRLPNGDGADIVANIAYEARSTMNLRHVPLQLILAVVEFGNQKKVLNPRLLEHARSVVGGMIAHVIQRPDEITELVALYWKVAKKPLTNQMKKGLAAAFAKFNDYQLRKYATEKGAVRLRDVMFLVHPKPTVPTQEYYWKAIADDTVTAPDTWESQLSAGGDKKEVFTQLIKDDKLGGLALLRNLRGMKEAGVPDILVRGAIATMKTDRILPFRFITAARYAPQFEDVLEGAMFRNLSEIEKLPGKTVLLLDHSSSMQGKLSAKSELTRWDAAVALGMLLREVCEHVVVMTFSSGQQYFNDAKNKYPAWAVVPPRRGFALRDAATKSLHWGGTDTRAAVQAANSEGYDRLIVFTDEQSATPVPDPLAGSRAYMVNIASAKNGIGYGAWNHLDGFSEALVSYIQQFEKLQTLEQLEAQHFDNTDVTSVFTKVVHNKTLGRGTLKKKLTPKSV